MKELSIEQKAKAYDEAIERARYWEKNPTVWSSDDICQKLFPELAESEDERIRKEMISWLKGFIGEEEGCGYTEDEIRERIAWLEKQGEKGINGKNREIPNSEQNSANRVEPKFSVGDWLVHKDLVGVLICITQIQAPHYYLTNNDSFIKFGEEDNYRPWTIQDAKDGDVLANNGNIILFEKVALSEDQDYKYIKCYCLTLRNSSGKVFFKGGSYNLDDNFYPATKEQRDLLFKKMKEAGYEWDAEKKELKKISQRMISAKAKEAMYNKPAWSEEDERMLKRVIDFIPQCMTAQGYNEYINWFKALKERVQLQSTWKPSDEQINALNYVVNLMASSERPTENDLYYNILKSLRQQLKKTKITKL